jgi:2-keto-4-pentenoate hydratase/2-oxohepta-3-ene-1,7-dioic acid hydratase in catechol pathway
MRLVRFLCSGRTATGVLDGSTINEVEDDLTTSIIPKQQQYLLSAVRLLPPCKPSKIIAVGLNYRDHAHELGLPVPDQPIIFLKPPTAVIGPEGTIQYPAMSTRVDYEAELGIVIKDTVSNIEPSRVRDHVLGYTCVNDVTARDLQKMDGQWTRAKSFDTFCPVGPWIETQLNPDDLLVESYLNNKKQQSSRTSQFIFSVNELVSFISRIMTLQPGDLITTGTPAGIGPMIPGDMVEVRIEGIGSLKNIVRKQELSEHR